MAADTATPVTPAAGAPAAPAAAPAPAAVSTKVAPPSPLALGDTAKILSADDTEFGKMFGIDAILAGKPFEFSPASAALDGAAAGEEADGGGTATAVEVTPTVPTGDDGEPLPAYREDSKGNLHAPDGKFIAKDGTKDGEGETATATDGTEPPAGETKEGEGETPAAEPVKLATDFNLLDGDKQEVEYPKDLTIKFTANGKEVELPLDRTVRLAKMGFYNEEKEQRFEQIEQRNAKLEPFAKEIYEESQTLQGHLDRILAGDDEFLAKAREHYKKETSPEAENARLRARVKQLESAPPRSASDTASAPAQAATTAAPVIQELIESNKDVVPEAEIWTTLGKLIAPYRDKAGAIPPERLRDVVAHVNGALRIHVESLAETRRLAAKSTADAALQQQVAKGKVLELKRKVTTAARPTGQRPPVTQSQPTPTAPTKANPTAEDTIESALQGAVGRMRAGG
jgi:hypothetical protein